ncbi:DNA-binding transcriptional LysR family regulator [Alicyclobacillus sacchari]|uniref:DNA-binding transcriptional LysR family regulator n=1 Tax=Alicyclobacillus sacchari TaxID=392010 RepID=A0A4R8LN27_9BACL|nr:LysR substrate-binding domain-containing protein [Alicyclobacillus sacchari]TDY45199.1 DNA-binding transcriptional LysR family regulator [Alicyclobacillus sacchari]GMA56792.1 putative HTH-type transcriptional regulator YybE [Alicyclobacillus sacchari]
MDWFQLRYFMRAAELENVSKAAEELSVSQPALSRAIAKLEEELAAPLFIRESRGVRLTPYGKTFLPYVQRAFAELAQGQEAVRALVNPSHGVLHIGLIYSLGTRFLPELIHAFSQDEPKISVQLIESPTRGLLECLERGDIDIAFCSPGDDFRHLERIEVLREDLVFIVPKEHKWAGHERAALIEGKDEPFVMYSKESGIRAMIMRYCKIAGFTPKIVMEGIEDLTVAGLVAAGLGIAIVPYNRHLLQLPIHVVHIDIPKCFRAVSMVWRKHQLLTPAARKFVNFVTQHRAELCPQQNLPNTPFE